MNSNNVSACDPGLKLTTSQLCARYQMSWPALMRYRSRDDWPEAECMTRVGNRVYYSNLERLDTFFHELPLGLRGAPQAWREVVGELVERWAASRGTEGNRFREVKRSPNLVT